MNMFQDISFYYNACPKIAGRIREERWGGLYYDRNRLRIDLLNETAFYILNQCNGQKTVKEIEDFMIEEFQAPEELIRQDLMMYLNFALMRQYIKIEGIEVPKIEGSAEAESNQYEKDDLSFLGGEKILGVEPNVLSAPVKVLIEFTHNCNLKCIHCFADADYCPDSELGYLDGELNTEQWLKVIDNLAEADVFDVFVSGGEPLMRKDIFKIMEHIKSKGMGFCLLTNATLITDEMAKKLKELGCYKVEANLDGPDAESYDEFRGVKGSFDATVLGIQACLRNGIGVRANVTATKKNVFRLREIIQTAWNIGVRELCAVPLEPGGRGHSNASELEITLDDHIEMQKYYAEVAAWTKEKFNNEFAYVAPVDFLTDNRDNPVVDFIDPNKIMPMCGAGRYHCSIGPDGHVILCPGAGKQIKITPGDCLNEDFKKVWHEADVFRAVRNPEIPGCKTCEFKNCMGGCHVRTFHKHGKVGFGPDPECRKVFLKKCEGQGGGE